MTDATPLASEQITPLIERLRSYRPTDEWGEGVHHVICDEAADALAALSATPAPSGWKLVPIEPTSEMTEAGEDANHYSSDDIIRNRADPVYRAMIEAAPAPSDQDASQAQGEVADRREAMAEALWNANPHKGNQPWDSVGMRRYNGTSDVRDMFLGFADAALAAAPTPQAPVGQEVERLRELLQERATVACDAECDGDRGLHDIGCQRATAALNPTTGAGETEGGK